jgi:hypothetical protein
MLNVSLPSLAVAGVHTQAKGTSRDLGGRWERLLIPGKVQLCALRAA